MSSLWDCEKCGYNHYEEGVKCVSCRQRQSWADEGRKDDQGKRRYSLLPKGTVNSVVDVLDYGSKKVR